MGISLAPKICWEKMSDLVAGLSNVDVIIEDILMYGKDMNDLNKHLQAVLERIEKTGQILNKDKCLFRKDRSEYFGHEISREGISPSVQKVSSCKE